MATPAIRPSASTPNRQRHSRFINRLTSWLLTHLRWDFVFQRPQHLLTRCARLHRVFVIEEPVFDDGPARLDVSVRQHGVHVVVPRFSACPPADAVALQARLLRDFLRDHRIRDYVLWYYTPMAMEFTRSLTAARGRLRLHGRALGVRRRAGRDATAGSKNCSHGLTSSSPAARRSTRASGTAIRMFTPSRAAWTWSTLRAAA